MDEAIRIYNPKGSILVASFPKKPISVGENPKIKYRKESCLATLEGIFKDHKKKEKELREKYPLFNLFYNYLALIILAVLLVSGISCGVIARTENKVNTSVETALADYKAEQLALANEEADKKAEEERVLAQSEAVIEHKVCTKLALVYQGADKFVDKYGYSERDFKSLGRCIFNRTENPAYPDDIIEVIDQPDQWVGYYSQNVTPMDKYYQMAVKHYREWKAETTKPVSNDYLWAEYTSKGIFLKYKYEAGPYDTRWRADA